MIGARRIRSFLANIGLLGFVTVFALGLAEVLVRLVAPQQLPHVRPDMWEPADSLGWVNRPNVRTTTNTGERTVHFYTDAEGMRVGAAGRKDAATRILLIGDSFAEALQVEYEQTFASLLEARLTQGLGYPVSVWDAGVDGWDPPQYLVRTRQLLDRHPFGLVIVSLYLGNDVVRQRPEHIPPRAAVIARPLRLPHRLSWSEFTDAILYPVNNALKTRSHLYVLLRTQLRTLLARTLLMRLQLSNEFAPEEMRRTEADSPRWSVTADICKDIAVSAARRGAPTLFVLIPSPLAADTAALRRALAGFGMDLRDLDADQPDRLMAKALHDRRLNVLQVQEAFRRAARAGVQLYGHVDRHLSPDGHVLLERLIEPDAMSLLQKTAADRGARGARGF